MFEEIKCLLVIFEKSTRLMLMASDRKYWINQYHHSSHGSTNDGYIFNTCKRNYNSSFERLLVIAERLSPVELIEIEKTTMWSEFSYFVNIGYGQEPIRRSYRYESDYY